MVPPAATACFHHIGGVVATSSACGQTTELLKLVWSSDASTMTWESRSEHIAHEHHVVVDTDRTSDFGLVTEVARGAQQVGVCVANLITTQATPSILVDQCTTSEPVIDDTGARHTVIIGERQCAQPTLFPANSHEAER